MAGDVLPGAPTPEAPVVFGLVNALTRNRFDLRDIGG
jgi:hypothetical protein